MSFSFGTPAASKPPAFSFGTPATSTPSATPSLFGQPAATSQPSSTPSLFGNTTSSTAPPAGGLFGAPAAGSQAPASTGLFGAQKPATPSLFGNTSAGTSAPSLFGSTPATSGATGGGLFGQQNASTGGTSLFGQQPASQPGASTSLFGSTTTSQPGQPGSLFGSSSTAQTGPLFGQQPGSAEPAQQPAVTAAPLFGQSQTAATASLFGAPKPAGSLFGSTNTGGFGASLSASQAQQSQQPAASVPRLGDPYPPPNPNEPSIESRLQAIKSAWDPADPGCKFQTYFYNEVLPPNKASMYGRPPQGTDDRAWQKAVRENPDPERYVPAIAIGFPAVRGRIESQVRQTSSHQALLGELHAHLDTLASEHSLKTSLRLLRAQQTATQLSARLMALVGRVGPLTANRNASLRKDEDELRVELEGMRERVERIKTRSNELWSGVGQLKARRAASESGEAGNGSGGGGGGGGEWAVVDEEGLKQILEILAQQQAGLDHLTKTLDGAQGDVEVIQEGFGLRAGGGSGSARSAVAGAGSVATSYR